MSIQAHLRYDGCMSPAKPHRDLSTIALRCHTYTLGHGTGHGPLEGGLRLTQGVTFDVDDPALDFLVTMSVCAHQGRLACSQITISQRVGGPSVNGRGLRTVVVDAYVRLIRDWLSDPNGQGQLLLVAEVGRSDDAVFFEAPNIKVLAEFSAAQRRRRPLSETLPLVADTYRGALAKGDIAPTEAVGRYFHYSRGHAARLVSEARKAGFLGPARRGAAGEVLQTDEEGEGE